MKDAKFIFYLSVLILLNVLAAYVLNFVSFKDIKSDNHSDDRFLEKLSVIDQPFEYQDAVVKPTKLAKSKKPLKPLKKPTKLVKAEKIKKKSKTLIVKKIEQKKSTQKRIKADIYSKLEKEFKKTNDFKTALKLSRLYYASKKYKNSLKWAKIANELNDKDDGSWLLFAKTKLKMGQKEIAKKALMTYIRVYNSKKVKELLNRISS